ncbi:MAG: DUF2254 domain-containing protein, partial [Gammaproteobacteria bacterium]|nr:DUF2254 domain-containing protein [Gammaproteobacteria bacterium]
TVSSGSDSDFVPQIAVLGALGMALASVAVLIMFIHHVPDTIHIGDVAADRGTELAARLDTMFMSGTEDANPDFDSNPFAALRDELVGVHSDRSGYFQTLDSDGLVDYCSKQKLVAKLAKRPGDFISKGELIMQYTGPTDTSENSTNDRMLAFLGIGRERTPAQDIRYLIEELSQIAARALSPSINDPFTAITCLDWLGNAVSQVADRPEPVSRLADQGGELRVILQAVTFNDVCDWVFKTIRPYVVADRNACIHMAKIFNNVLSCASDPLHQSALREHGRIYQQESMASCQCDSDRREIKTSYQLLVQHEAS